jgi:predicted CoA-binding protein
MDHDSYPDKYILSILGRTRTIAMVGASPKWNRPSYFAMKYLQKKGYRIIPVNPGHSGTTILNEPVYADLCEIPETFDMVDIFRNSHAAGAICDQAVELAASKQIRTVWMQLGVHNEDAARRAEHAGLSVVMNRCPKIEFGRLHTELGWGGFNSNIISSRRRRLRPFGPKTKAGDKHE